mmetsp:Transcript_3927/g.8651  ORF Transcript_3927/g.8651 Transcript_3927/m.8651 type:complete len:857 (-) Transcript_3927:64-2634(-)
MPPFQEESMCRSPNLRSNSTMAPQSATMAMNDNNNDPGQNSQNDGNGRTNTTANHHAGGRQSGGVSNDSPISPNMRLSQRHMSPRIRHRGQLKTKNGRHITNINRINVINNYGNEGQHGGNYFSTSPNKRKQQHQNNNNYSNAKMGWFVARTVLALMLIFWFGTMVSVVRSVHKDAVIPANSNLASSSVASEVRSKTTEIISLARWKKLSERMKDAGLLRGTTTIAQHQQQQPGDVAKQAVDSTTSNGEDNAAPKSASIFELSLFGNQAPSDFQLYTPHAPSCSKPLDADGISFTLVSQLSEDRVWMIQHHCQRWGHNPMSVVVFSDRTAQDVKSEVVLKGCSEEHITVQTVSPTKYDPTGTEYPVNLLRNIAFAAVKTTHIVYADVDFWPSTDLHSTLMSRDVKARFASDPKLATVVPVFQMYRRCKEYKDCQDKNIPSMPKRKGALFSLIKRKEASTFDPTNAGGHGSTKYITWRDQELGTFVDLPCIKSNRYEPYLAFRYCSDLPPFQEGFTGYGKNKMTWIMQLRRAGYLFTQLGGVFLVHYPHLSSQARLEWDKKPGEMGGKKSLGELKKKEKSNIDWESFKRARVDALFLDFKEWLDGTVEDESRLQMCEDALNDDARLWVHPDEKGAGEDDDDDDEVDMKEGTDDDGAYFQEYSDYVEAKEAFLTCEVNHGGTGDAAAAECFQAASDFIESSILWSLVGAASGYLGSSTQMELLVEAEKCAVRFMDVERQPQYGVKIEEVPNTAGGDQHQDTTNKDNYSFPNLMADLYTNMGVVAKNSHSKGNATVYIGKALALNPSYESAQKILSQLNTMDDEEELSQDSESSDGDIEEGDSVNEESTQGEGDAQDTD